MIVARSPGLVSIVTPSLNQGQFIERCIESVGAQDHRPLEHIVIDGGSTDPTVSVLERHPEITWVSEPDDGQVEAINKGFGMARGEFVAWLNADDFYLPGAVASAVRTLRQHPDAAFVFANYVVVNERGEELRLVRPERLDLRHQLTIGNLIPSPTVFMRRQALDAVGQLDGSYRNSFDYDLWNRFVTQFPIVYCDEYWTCFRLHESSKTVSRSAEFIREDREIVRRYRGRRLRLFPDYRVRMIAHRWPLLGLALGRALRAARLLRRGELRELGRRARQNARSLLRAR